MISNVLINSLAGIVRAVTVSLLLMVITSILINNLGKLDYAKVAVFTSINQYIGLLILAITGTIFRFVSIEYLEEKKVNKANYYISSAFFVLTIMSSIIFLFVSICSEQIGMFLNIENFDRQSRLFLIISVSSFLITSLVSVFIVAPSIKEKFYLSDFALVISRLIQLLFIIIFIFIFDNFNILNYGYSLLISSLLYLTISIFISKSLIPEFQINLKYVSVRHTRKLLRMGYKVVLNNLGILLYTNTDIFIISIYLGIAYVADFALSLQLAIFISLVGGVVSRLFNPPLAKLIAQKKFIYLRSMIVSNSKIFFVYIGIFYILITSLSDEIFRFWLQDGSQDITSYVAPLAFYQLIHQSTVLFFMYFTLANKLSVPLAVTIFAGIINIIFSIAIVTLSQLGVMGVITVTIITVILKTLIFNSFYTCNLLKINFVKLIFIKIKILLFILAASYFAHIAVELFFNRSFLHISIFTIAMPVVYFFISYFFIFNNKEKVAFLHMTKTYRILKKYA